MANTSVREDFWRKLSEVVRKFDPERIIREASRPVRVALVGSGPSEVRQVEEFFVPEFLSQRKAEQVRESVSVFLLPLAAGDEKSLRGADVVVCSQAAAPEIAIPLPQLYIFRPDDPQALVSEIITDHWDLALPLARNFLAFRSAIQRRWLRSVALENTLFAMLTAVPDAAPEQLSLQATNGLGSSTVFLTSNQLRLTLLMAAANDSDVGYKHQAGQITALTTAALGWRALARELASRVSPARGVFAKGLLALAGTCAAGLALEQLHTLGRSMTRDEKRDAYEKTYRVGRKVLEGILDSMGRSSSAA